MESKNTDVFAMYFIHIPEVLVLDVPKGSATLANHLAPAFTN